MGSGEVNYSFRTKFPDIFARERENLAQLEAYHNGALVAPTGVGTFTLLGETGDTISTSATTIVGGIMKATVPAVDLPSTLGFSQRLQERWTMPMPDGTTRLVRREAGLALIQLSPSTDANALLDQYPNLLTEFNGSVTSLQPFLDVAWGKLIRRLWAMGSWPDLIVSESQLVDPLQELSYFVIFKALFRTTSGVARWEKLMDIHKAEYNRAWSEMAFKKDLDHDGLADSDERRGNSTLVHRNTAPRRVRSRDPRF